MAMIGQKIGFGPNWPHLAPLGGSKVVLELTFTKSDFKFIQIMPLSPPGANLVKIGQIFQKKKFQHEKKSKKKYLPFISLVFGGVGFIFFNVLKHHRR